MYAIVNLNSQQYKVQEGETILVPRIKEEVGKAVALHDVLLFSDGQEVKVGQPHLKDVKVTAEVLEHLKGKKTVSFKYRRRKNSACKKGQRQLLSRLKIKKISAK